MKCSAGLIVAVLRREYPEIADNIVKSIHENLPRPLINDLSEIQVIVDSFVKLRGDNANVWMSSKITKERELLLAVLLLLFNPQRIIETETRTRKGLVTAISGVIKIPRATISVSISKVIASFRFYQNFRDEANHMYDLIKQENKLFNNP